MQKVSESSVQVAENLPSIFGQHFAVHRGHDNSYTETVKKRSIYNLVSFANNIKVAVGWHNAFDEIIGERLTLSMQPNSWTGHPLLIKTHSTHGGEFSGLNVAVIENHAMDGSSVGWLLGTTSVDDYREAGIEHHWLSTPDFTTNLPDDLFIDTLVKMRVYYDENKPINVHCKSGSARSEMVVSTFIAFMFLIGDETVSSLLFKFNAEISKAWSVNEISNPLEGCKTLYMMVREFVKEKRANVTTDEVRIDMARDKAASVLLKLHGRFTKFSEISIDRSADYQFLNALAQSDEFKAISMNLSSINERHGDQSYSVQCFLDRLLNNKDNWYEELRYAAAPKKQEKGFLCNYAEVPLIVELKRKIDSLVREYSESKYSAHVFSVARLSKEMLK